MNKKFVLPGSIVVLGVVLGMIPMLAGAATLNIDSASDITFSLPSGENLTVVHGSKAESVTINDDSTITVVLGTDSDITFQAPDLSIMTVSPVIATYDCSNQLSSLHLISTSSQTVTVTVSSSRCPTSTSGGGSSGSSGGGGGAVVTSNPPTNTSIVINGGASQTTSPTTTLALAATNATQMVISNSSDFNNTTWQPYATTAQWVLLPGEGTRTVYAKFKSSAGDVSSAVSDSIQLISAAPPKRGDIKGDDGGELETDDHHAKVDFPAGAYSGSGAVSITPHADFTEPKGEDGVVGGLAYDFGVEKGTTDVATFSKPVTLTFKLSDSDLAGFLTSTLSIAYWDTTTNQWVKIGGTYDPVTKTVTVTTNHFTTYAVIGQKTVAGTGSLIKLQCPANAGVNDPCKAVYYLGSNGKRYVFPNQKTYLTWYADFSSVKTVSSDELASYVIGGNVTYRPGVKLIKIQTDPKVYAVSKNGMLRWVSTGEIASSLFGASWAKSVEDVPDAFFVNYRLGSDLNNTTDYDRAGQENASVTIGQDKGL